MESWKAYAVTIFRAAGWILGGLQALAGIFCWLLGGGVVFLGLVLSGALNLLLFYAISLHFDYQQRILEKLGRLTLNITVPEEDEPQQQ